MNRWLWLGCLLVLAGGWGVRLGLTPGECLGLLLVAVVPLVIGWRRLLRDARS